MPDSSLNNQQSHLNTAGVGRAGRVMLRASVISGQCRRLGQQWIDISRSHCLTEQFPHRRVNWRRLRRIRWLNLTTITSTLHWHKQCKLTVDTTAHNRQCINYSTRRFSSRKPTSHCANMQDYGRAWGGEGSRVLLNRTSQLLQKS